jgi:ATP-dependent exoDNAse (exonuclease V) alpha subunit
MQSAGVDAQTTASFLHDTQLQQRNGQTPDFSNTLFLLDESSMVGLADTAKALSLIAAGEAVPYSAAIPTSCSPSRRGSRSG